MLAVISGGTSGIGSATAVLFAEKGYEVHVLGRNEEKGTAFEEERSDLTITYHQADAGSEKDVEAFFQELADADKTVDVLFNNAGTVEFALGPLQRVKEEDWNALFDANLKSVYLMIKHATPLFDKKAGASIINNAAIVGNGKYPSALPAYASAKAGVVAMTKSLAVRHAKQKMRFNSISPGPVNTSLAHRLYGGESNFEEASKKHPRGEAADPKEIAEVVYFLASDKASYINGHNLVVDGGYSLA
ncbi:NAD(P)-dependent dehydrogenase (short-subunit alcohol dehydrogenase family) [Sinobaca qinghaiensis]|uniref:NAD(P)-dependent dehydrogenase (Short-subunit alcohol dehydrogenase family) n=1 Tax=Sinobaca qinghaiensis TaxID=342944 RepID=A0A419V8P6_9BACL|nr:SDR family oxidoreductase [Sinobaca qinghaiensis]RKD76486.1 NAD(P)-dependent dehydrogenase (short-subunit alcohol dehydrogenase family) [Sinobaca qinghaiensis]